MKVRIVKVYSKGETIKFPDYVVSRSGRIFRWTDGLNTWKGKEAIIGFGEYPWISLRKPGEHKLYRLRLHKIVAHTFLGKPLDGFEVNHKDANKHNSRLSNLEYVTHAENMKHAVGLGLIPRGEDRKHTKVLDKEVKKIRSLYYKKKWSRNKIADFYSISAGHVRDILTGKQRNHLRKSPEEIATEHGGIWNKKEFYKRKERPHRLVNIEEIKEMIRVYSCGKISQRNLAELFGVSRGCIVNILHKYNPDELIGSN